MKDLVIFPEIEDPFKNTGEGGIAVFFVLLSDSPKDRRQKCLAGSGIWPLQDVIVWPPEYIDINREISKIINFDVFGRAADLIMLVASTKISFWNKSSGYYWHATEKDLTEEGTILFKMIEKIYGQKPDIVTLLDT